MVGLSLKAKAPSPSRFTLQRQSSVPKKEAEDLKQSGPSRRNIQIYHHSPLVELRYTQEWTRQHLRWFNVDFEPSVFHTIPVAFQSSCTSPLLSPGTSYDEMLATVFSLVNEYREFVWLLFKVNSSMMMPDEWNNARLPEKGVSDWVEVSARPANATQLFACSLVKVLFCYLSNGKSLLEFDRNQRLSFVYAGHAIRKDKYRGIGVYHGKPVLAIETDTKYLYGRTLTPNQEMEYANASHIFADMLAMSQRPSEIKDEATPSNTSQERTSKVVFSQPLTKELFVINVVQGGISLFWSSISEDYIAHIVQYGRPPKSLRVTLYHTSRYPIFTADGIKSFITEFTRAYPRIIASQ